MRRLCCIAAHTVVLAWPLPAPAQNPPGLAMSQAHGHGQSRQISTSLRGVTLGSSLEDVRLLIGARPVLPPLKQRR